MENENKVQAKDVEIDLEKNGKDVAGGKFEAYGLRSATTANYDTVSDALIDVASYDKTEAVPFKLRAGDYTVTARNANVDRSSLELQRSVIGAYEANWNVSEDNNSNDKGCDAET